MPPTAHHPTPPGPLQCGVPGAAGPAVRVRSAPTAADRDRAAAQARLIADGERWTPLREAVFAAMQRLGRPSTAYTVAAEVARVADRHVPANSAYRVLDCFVAHGLAHRLVSSCRYVLNPPPFAPRTGAFLICDACRSATYVDVPSVRSLVTAEAGTVAFQLATLPFELHGLCDHCAFIRDGAAA